MRTITLTTAAAGLASLAQPAMAATNASALLPGAMPLPLAALGARRGRPAAEGAVRPSLIRPRLRGGRAVALAAAVCLLGAAGGLGAQDMPPAASIRPYAVDGPGAMRCADFTAKADDAETTREVAIWLAGYLTAFQRLMPNVYDLTPWQGPGVLVGLLQGYCEANDQARVEQGASKLIGDLAPKAIRGAAKRVTLGTGDKVVVLYAPVVAEIRERLAAAGHPPGPTEADLAAALAAYQAEKGLAVTGLADQATLVILLH